LKLPNEILKASELLYFASTLSKGCSNTHLSETDEIMDVACLIPINVETVAMFTKHSWTSNNYASTKHDCVLFRMTCNCTNKVGTGNRDSRRANECSRYDHYSICRLDIRRDNEFATGYGYPKTAFKWEPDTDPDIRNAFIDISRIETFGKSCTLHNYSFIIFRSIFSAFCAL